MAIAGGATIAAPAGVEAQAPEKPNGNASPPTAAAKANEREHPPEAERLTTEKTGSDFMVDVCKTLNLDYLAACPGSTFRALQESFINYGQNKRPEWLTCLHEEVSVGMAHGYAKVAGKPMAAMVHGRSAPSTRRWPSIMPTATAFPFWFLRAIGCNRRTPARCGVVHSVQDGAATVRDFVSGTTTRCRCSILPNRRCVAMRWPVRSLRGRYSSPRIPSFQEAPLDERELRRLRIPRLATPSQAAGDANSLREAAKMLVAAETPVIIAAIAMRVPNRRWTTSSGLPSSCRLP